MNNMFTKRDYKVKGSVRSGLEAVREVFEEHFKAGDEISAQLCVVQDGQIVNLKFTVKLFK